MSVTNRRKADLLLGILSFIQLLWSRWRLLRSINFYSNHKRSNMKLLGWTGIQFTPFRLCRISCTYWISSHLCYVRRIDVNVQTSILPVIPLIEDRIMRPYAMPLVFLKITWNGKIHSWNEWRRKLCVISSNKSGMCIVHLIAILLLFAHQNISLGGPKSSFKRTNSC